MQLSTSTCLFPALTLGCGAVGGSSSSNNIGPWDLINIKRVAWGVREKEDLFPATGSSSPATVTIDDSRLEELIRQMVQKLVK